MIHIAMAGVQRLLRTWDLAADGWRLAAEVNWTSAFNSACNIQHSALQGSTNAHLRISVPGLQTRVRDVRHQRQKAVMSGMPGRQSRQTVVAARDGRRRRTVARKRQRTLVWRVRRWRCRMRVPRERALTRVNRTTLRVVIPPKRSGRSADRNVRRSDRVRQVSATVSRPNAEPAHPGFRTPLC